MQSKPKAAIRPFTLFLSCSSAGCAPLLSGISMNIMAPLLSQLGAPSWLIPLVLLISSLTGVLQPFIGLISDKCTLRLGKRKPFIVAGVFLALISLVLYTLLDFGAVTRNGTKLALCVVAFLFLSCALPFLQSMPALLAFDVSGDGQRMLAAFMLLSLTSVFQLLGFGLTILKLAPYLFVAGFVIIVNVPAFLVAKDEPANPNVISVPVDGYRSSDDDKLASANESLRSPQPMDHSQPMSPFKMLKKIFKGMKTFLKNPVLLYLMIYVTLSLMAHLYITSSASLFVTNVFYGADDPRLTPEEQKKGHDDGLIVSAMAMMAMVVTTFATAILGIVLVKLVGPKPLLFGGELTMVVLEFVLVFMNKPGRGSVWVMFLVTINAGYMLGLIQTVPNALVAELIDRKDLGMFTGIYTCFSLIGSTIAMVMPFLLNVFLPVWSGGKHYLQWNYLVCAILSVFSMFAVLLLRFPKKLQGAPTEEEEGRAKLATSEMSARDSRLSMNKEEM